MKTPEIAVGQTTISDIVELLADRFGDNSALEYHSLGIKNNFRQFRDICDTAARGLMALGINKGEHIAIWANNIPEWVHIQYGSARMGAILVTVNTSYKSFELEYLMKQSDSTTILLTGGVRETDEYLKVINDVCPELKDCSPGILL